MWMMRLQECFPVGDDACMGNSSLAGEHITIKY